MTKTMSDKKPESRLKYRAAPMTGLIIVLLSLFCQWLNWFAFEKIGYSWVYTLITPLILCLMYHFVQLDAGREGNFTRGFFFLCAVVIPFILGVLITVVMVFEAPDMSLFDPGEDYTGSMKEIIATYAGRIALTSLY